MSDGGQAFPSIKTDRQYTTDINVHSAGGMTLRDYFAARALQGIITNEAMIQRHREVAQDNLIGEEILLATSAYSLADAMLKVRDGDV